MSGISNYTLNQKINAILGKTSGLPSVIDLDTTLTTGNNADNDEKAEKENEKKKNDGKKDETEKKVEKKVETAKKQLLAPISTKGPSCGVIIVDNFYNNAMATRDYILTQEFSVKDQQFLDNKTETDKFSQDLTKWQQVDKVGNIFNRLILFDSKRFHMSMDYFGDSKENGRLFQVFFFSTEK